jgi:insulysin
MGTTKYPAENEYSRYLNEHGGASNAFTGMENTNYFFDVANHGFEGAVDRFAQFFIAPLFDDSCTERERNAVDSEHKKNLQSDVWRMWQLEKDLCHPEHPYHKFGTGNCETLGSEVRAQGLDIRRLLLDFHATHYSANLMSLVLLGPQSVEELEHLAIQYFSPIPNKGYAAPSFAGWPNPLEGSALRGAALRILPIKDTKTLELIFPFPPTHPVYQSKPERVLSHLIGHEAEGSVLALLKHHGWALGLSAGAWFGGLEFGFFRISIECTPAGMANISPILTLLFDYVLGVLGRGIPESVFREVCVQRGGGVLFLLLLGPLPRR